jgi:hypothetical protein
LLARIKRTGFDFSDYDFSNKNNNKNNSSNSSNSNSDAEMKVESDPSASSLSFGSKFLTSSILLGLQLNDPSFKKQVCSQIIFFVHSIRFRGPSFLSNSQSSTSGKVSAREKSTRNVDAGVSAIQAATERTQVLQDIESIEKRSFRLIDCTSNGVEFSKVLRRILAREVRMIAWKAEKCPTYGRKRTLESAMSTEAVSSTGGNKKIKKIPFSWEVSLANNPNDPAVMHPRIIQKNKASFNSTVFDDSFEEMQHTFDCNTQNVIEYAQNLVDRVPDFDRHISLYIDAEEGVNVDPDFPIPHPKTNPFYVWRAMRLLTQSNVSVFEAMPDGKLEKGLVRLGLIKAKSVEEESIGISSDEKAGEDDDIDEENDDGENNDDIDEENDDGENNDDIDEGDDEINTSNAGEEGVSAHEGSDDGNNGNDNDNEVDNDNDDANDDVNVDKGNQSEMDEEINHNSQEVHGNEGEVHNE